MQHQHNNTNRHNLAAIFLDYENLYYHVKNAYKDPPQANDVVHEIVRALRKMVINDHELDPIIYAAYADWEQLATRSGLTDAQRSLILMGVDTKNVLGTDHKNAADMRLCIDLMEVLYTRPNVEHYILVAGDRDYIPVVQHLRQQAKHVTAVSFRETLSGDLLEIVGTDRVKEAKELISPATRVRIEAHRDKWIAENPPLVKGVTVVGKINLADPKPIKKPHTPAYRQTAVPQEEIVWSSIRAVTSEKDKTCLQEIIRFKQERNVPEIWLSPFLRTLTDVMPFLADFERKALISDLELAGAIRVVKREGDPNPFSVIILNYNHPTVVELID